MFKDKDNYGLTKFLIISTILVVHYGSNVTGLLTATSTLKLAQFSSSSVDSTCARVYQKLDNG